MLMLLRDLMNPVCGLALSLVLSLPGCATPTARALPGIGTTTRRHTDEPVGQQMETTTRWRMVPTPTRLAAVVRADSRAHGDEPLPKCTMRRVEGREYWMVFVPHPGRGSNSYFVLNGAGRVMEAQQRPAGVQKGYRLATEKEVEQLMKRKPWMRP